MNRFSRNTIVWQASPFIILIGLCLLPSILSAQACPPDKIQSNSLPEKDPVEGGLLQGTVLTEDISRIGGHAYTTHVCMPIGWHPIPDSIREPKILEASVTLADIAPAETSAAVACGNEGLVISDGLIYYDCYDTIDDSFDGMNIGAIMVDTDEILSESILDAGFSDLPADSPWLQLMTDCCRRIEAESLNGMVEEKSTPTEVEAGIR